MKTKRITMSLTELRAVEWATKKGMPVEDAVAQYKAIVKALGDIE